MIFVYFLSKCDFLIGGGRKAEASEASTSVAQEYLSVLCALHSAVNLALLSTPHSAVLFFDSWNTYSQAQSRSKPHISASYHLSLHRFGNPNCYSAGPEAVSLTVDRSNDTRVRPLRDNQSLPNSYHAT